MKNEHPALQAVFQEPANAPFSDRDRSRLALEQTTSPSLARALAVGCLSRLDQNRTSVDIWDPTVGAGYAGQLLVHALRSAGVRVRYRGQDISDSAVSASRHRFEGVPDVELAVGNTLERDEFEGFAADLVIVDAPWSMDWESSSAAVQARQESGAFSFGVPQRSDSTWLFISLALEKLRPAAEGGGRVAALVNPSVLSAVGKSVAVRKAIVESGLLESVTRLPEGLAPNTSIPLYLLTFTNRAGKASKNRAMVADMQTQFTTDFRYRMIPDDALRELESGLRTRKSGRRNRSIALEQFIRREVRLSRPSSQGNRLSWRLATYNDTPIDAQLLKSRYGADSDVSVDAEPRETFDLDPSRFFGDGSQELLKDLQEKGWASRRLSTLLSAEPEIVKDSREGPSDGQLFIPATRNGLVSGGTHANEANGRVLSVQLDGDLVQTDFLAAWLNSEQGISSRRRAIDASSTGIHVKALRSDTSSLIRWADELIVPVPDSATQLELTSVDERLSSFQTELKRRRESVWIDPDSADEAMSRFAGAFDDSLTAWLDQLPFPLASALRTAETMPSPGEQQRAYLHAWEAIVTFHATLLLSASRSDPGRSSEIEAGIRQTLRENHLGIERASFGTWLVIIERISKDLRRTLERDDPDELAQVRRAFGDLSRAGIERLSSNALVQKFKHVSSKRNTWLGHTGFTSEADWQAQVVSLTADLRELRQLLGDVWSQLKLVRAGKIRREPDGWVQLAEVVVGTRTPFASREFSIGDPMIDGLLYLVKDGSESPLRLGQFVQLRSAPPNAQYTSYFYNRTEGSSVRMVSYQHGPGDELQDDVELFRSEFGGLARE